MFSIFGKKKDGPAEKKPIWKETLDVVVSAAVMALLARSFLVQAFTIPSGSMEDTLLIGDFLFVNKFLYGAKIPFTEVRLPGLRDPAPGDIIVFRPPNERQDYIKRCIAIEGQSVEVRDGVVYRDGVAVEEDFTKFMGGAHPPRWISPRNFGPVTVPEGHLFLMGDNRDNSKDSRFADVGFKDWKQTGQGKAVFIYWSWNTERKFPRFDRVGDLIH
ncbi:signal peptidase I [bacterium]|nr:signal peptidase I [bacterium]